MVDPETGELLEEQLTGCLDAVVRFGDEVTVLEHKTAARAWSQDQLEYDLQVSLYQAVTGAERVRLQVLTKTKVPKLLVHDLSRQERQQVEAAVIVDRHEDRAHNAPLDSFGDDCYYQNQRYRRAGCTMNPTEPNDPNPPDASDDWLTHDALCDATGESRRTVRFYILNGLLSAPVGAGPAARYPQGHVQRLLLIRKLQSDGMQLSRIRDLLEAMRDPDVAEALQQAPAGQQTAKGAGFTRSPESGLLHSSAEHEVDDAPQVGVARSQWEHIVLEPGVELHLRRPLGVSANRRVQKILEFVKKQGQPHESGQGSKR